VAWTFFASALGSAAISFERSSNLITKVYFPIESLPIANVLAHFVNFLISLVLLVIALLVAGLPLGPSLVLLPVIVIAQLATALGLGLLVACLTVYFRDLEHLVTLGLTAWFYLTPVLYPLDPRALPPSAATYIPLLKLNPLSWFLESYHAVLYYGTWPDPTLFWGMLAFSLISLLGGYALFLRVRPRLPEEV
jgi:ABC-type polysaccharide/polyol phosphate export permease